MRERAPAAGRLLFVAVACLTLSTFIAGQSIDSPGAAPQSAVAPTAIPAVQPPSAIAPEPGPDGFVEPPQLLNPPGTKPWDLVQDGRYANLTVRALLRQACYDQSSVPVFPAKGTCDGNKYTLNYNSDDNLGMHHTAASGLYCLLLRSLLLCRPRQLLAILKRKRVCRSRMYLGTGQVRFDQYQVGGVH